MTAEELHEGIFNLNTRRFGTVAEVMIQRLVQLTKGQNLFHDLYDELKNHRVEVKFSTVRKKNDRSITESTVLQCIKDEAASIRQVRYANWSAYDFDCNIQQIKRDQFEILYYGLFFQDAVLIFRMETANIGTDRIIQYSDKQHKGNTGEGQFHITPKTLQHHVDTYLYAQLTYPKLLELLT